MRIHALICLAVIGLAFVQPTPAEAQFRGRGDRGGDDRRDDDERRGDRDRDRGSDGERRGWSGDRDRGGPWGGGGSPWGGGPWGGGGGGGGGPWGNPEDFWKRFDRNGDGMIGPDEVDERFRERLGIDKPIKISDLIARRERENRDRNGNDRSPEKTLVPGFGVEADASATVPGFGPPENTTVDTAAAVSTNSSEARPASSSGSNGGGITGNAYVSGVLEKFDADKNGILEGDEIAKAKLPPSTDADKDGKITREELMAAFPSKNPSSSTNGTQNGVKRSYRFASAHERLPSSAKSWIISRDKNGDGQVSMHEFSSTWSDSKVREFQRYDQNGDGVVTAEEYLAR